MIGRLRGILLEKQAPDLLVEVNGGVSYEVKAPLSTFYRLPEVGQAVTILTHFVVREDAQQLYGFYDEMERSLFRTLIKVNGVGPRMALTVLSSIEPKKFIACVNNNDVTTLVRLPGVGKKTAERLIVEMSGKLSEWEIDAEAASGQSQAEFNTEIRTIVKEAVGALVALGFKQQEASRVINKIPQAESMTSESLIREALKNL